MESISVDFERTLQKNKTYKEIFLSDKIQK